LDASAKQARGKKNLLPSLLLRRLRRKQKKRLFIYA
jgi:hypothetical protein